MKTEHKYAQVLRWIADGEMRKIQIRWRTPDWMDLKNRGEIVYDEIIRGVGDYEFRLKPRTISVNGRDIVAGEDSPPTGEFFFTDIESSDCFGSTVWGGTRLDKLRLERGLVHLTKENAIAHAKAMLGID